MGSFNSKAELSHLFHRSVCSICVCVRAQLCFIILTAYCLSIPLCYELIHALLLPSTQACIFNWMLLQEGRKKKRSINQFILGDKVVFRVVSLFVDICCVTLIGAPLAKVLLSGWICELCVNGLSDCVLRRLTQISYQHDTDVIMWPKNTLH